MSDAIAGAVDITAKRTRHLETLEYIARAGTADAITDGLIVYDHGFGNSAALWTIAAAAGVFETDPNMSVTITLPVAATVYVLSRLRWRSDTIRTISVRYQTLMDAVTVGTGTTEYLGEPVASTFMNVSVLSQFTGVAAGIHTFQLQAARFALAHTIDISTRQMLVVAIQA